MLFFFVLWIITNNRSITVYKIWLNQFCRIVYRFLISSVWIHRWHCKSVCNSRLHLCFKTWISVFLIMVGLDKFHQNILHRVDWTRPSLRKETRTSFIGSVLGYDFCATVRICMILCRLFDERTQHYFIREVISIQYESIFLSIKKKK